MGNALVTGAASGIGRALARQLAEVGHHVHLADISATADLAAEIAGTPHHLDVADPAAWEALADRVGDIDTLCLNAGIVGPSLGPPWEVQEQEWHRILGVNVLGAVNGLRSFVPRMVAAGAPARIVITASLAGVLTFPGGGAYGATKHALLAIAEQAALHLAGSPISVTALCPALVRTGMSEVGADPDEFAREALAAAFEGRFVVMPQEWAEATSTRAARLIAGEPPIVPSPTTSDGGA